jgi:hypothetical protein
MILNSKNQKSPRSKTRAFEFLRDALDFLFLELADDALDLLHDLGALESGFGLEDGHLEGRSHAAGSVVAVEDVGILPSGLAERFLDERNLQAAEGSCDLDMRLFRPWEQLFILRLHAHRRLTGECDVTNESRELIKKL